MEKNPTNRKSVREVFAGEEIALGDLFALLLERKKYVYISVGCFFILGILVAITSPLEYEANVKILSENSPEGNTNLGGLSGLAGLAGITLPNSASTSNELSSDMYPSIVKSEPFLMQLMQEKFHFQSKGVEISLYEYFSKERPGHLLSKIFNFIRHLPGRFFALFEKETNWQVPATDALIDSAIVDNPSPRIVNISFDEQYVISQLEERISIETEGRITTISVTMPEPYLSAEFNSVVQRKVVEYVIKYRTEKQRQNLQFIEERTAEAERKFVESQLLLAQFRDTHQSVVNQTARTREEQLLAEYNLAFNLYNSLRQQLEQTRIQLKKETPLFSEFEPVSVPLDESEPNIASIIILYTFGGFFLGILVLIASLIRSYFKE